MPGNINHTASKPLSRRRLLQFMAAGTTGLFAGVAGLPFSPRVQVAHATPMDDAFCQFPQGIASGDPQPDAIMLWTRIEKPSNPNAPIDLVVQLASTEDFKTVVIERTLRAEMESDHTVRFLAEGLEPDTQYFYRFIAGSNTHHTVGRTRTAPEGDIDSARFAVVSCSSSPHGYFNVYRALANRNDLDAVIHLGDYIYEYAQDEYGELLLREKRALAPAHEIVSLSDYRRRHAMYKLDEDLKAATSVIRLSPSGMTTSLPTTPTLTAPKTITTAKVTGTSVKPPPSKPILSGCRSAKTATAVSAAICAMAICLIC